MLPPLPVSAADVKRRLDQGERVVILDTRSPDNWDAADRQLKGALRFRPSEIQNHLRLLPQGQPMVTYCECPNELSSTQAAQALVENGWKDVHPIQGGFSAAVQAGFATEGRAGTDTTPNSPAPGPTVPAL